MAVPFASLIPQRSRVLPQGGAILGQLTGSFQRGLEAGRLRAAEDEAPGLIMDYLDAQAAGYQPTLGSLAAPYPGGPSTAPRTSQPAGFNGAPTQANADMQAALTPGSPTFDGRFALREDNASQQNPPPASPYATNIAGYGTNLNTTGLDTTFGPALDSAINAYIAQGGDPSTIQINSLVRSTEEQQRLYDAYQRGEIGLAAPPGSSRHEYGSAADLQSGPFLDWLHQNASQYGLSFLQGSAFNADPGHVQLAGASPAGTRAPAIPAGAGGTQAQPGGWQPPTGQERALLRAMIINPVTRDMGLQLAMQRMVPPAPPQPDFGFTEVNGVLYATDQRTGQAVPVAGNPNQPRPEDIVTVNGQLVNRRTGEVIGDYRDPEAPATAEPPRTEQILMPDGQVHIMGFNPATGMFDRDMGLADPGGQWAVNVGPDGAVSMTQGRGGGGAPSGAALQAQYLYDIAAPELPIVEENFTALTNLGNQIAARGGDATYWSTSPEYQRAANALRVIIQNYLYSVTGAAAPQGEVDNWFNSVMPRIGESTDAVADKLQRVRNMVGAMQVKAAQATGNAGAAPPSAAPAAAPAAPPSLVVTPPGAGGPPPTLFYDPTTDTLVPVTP